MRCGICGCNDCCGADFEIKVSELEGDRNEWKSLYEELHKLHAEGKIDNSDSLLKENQRLKEAIDNLEFCSDPVFCHLCTQNEKILQKALGE